MIAASEKVVAQMSPSSNTASSFYKSTPPSALSQESFHPPKQYHHVKSSAKRALVLSTTQNATTVNREEEDEDFQPAKQLRQAPVSQATRPPLSDLPRYQTPSYQALAKSERSEEFEGCVSTLTLAVPIYCVLILFLCIYDSLCMIGLLTWETHAT